MNGGFGWSGGFGWAHGTPNRAEASVGAIEQPAITLKSLLIFGDKLAAGRLVKAVAVPWYEILAMIKKDPESIYQIDPFKWEEIIAGAYERAGFDEVVLTPRSGDGGKDIIATKHGAGSVRFYDQVKAYRPGHLVTANDVRAILGVIAGSPDVSKGIITTTSRFAPRIREETTISQFVPFRLELKDKDELIQWLDSLSENE